MRSEICHFSGLAIYPGHGKTFIKADGKKVILINGKSEKKLKAKKNPRKITWTILYRRKNKKGSMTEIESRKRNRRALKAQRGIGGQSWAEIQAKKTVKPEVRKAQRDLAIAAAKQKKKEEAASRKKASAAAKKAAPKAANAVPKNQKSAAKGAAKNFKK
jgi:large subunit ribosomal protein L24e